MHSPAQTGLTHVSLFSGVGGFDLALAAAGIPTAAMCEIDKHAQGVLRDRFPGIPLFDDVQEVTADELYALGLDPESTILTGGFPCQSLSQAGRQRGLARGSGTASSLFWEIERILYEFPARYFIIENVPNLLHHDRGRTMGTVIRALSELGYGLAWRVLNARSFGVPQRRRRVFLVGSLGSDGRDAATVLFEPDGGWRNPPTRSKTRQGHPRTAEGGVGGSRSDGLDPLAYQCHGTNVGPIGTLKAGGQSVTSGVPFILDYVPDESATITAGSSATPGVRPPGRRQEDDVNLIAFSLRGRAEGNVPEVHGDGQTVGALRAASGGSTRDMIALTPTYIAEDTSTIQAGGGERGYRIDAESAAGGQLLAFAGQAGGNTSMPTYVDESPTLISNQQHSVLIPMSVAENQRAEVLLNESVGSLSTGGGKPGQGYPVILDGPIVRRLTPTETGRLQGFPDDHTLTSDGKPQSDTQRYKQHGNAIAVPVVEWIAHRLVAVHTGQLPVWAPETESEAAA